MKILTKKFIPLLTCLLFALVLAACSGANGIDENKQDTESSAGESSKETTEEDDTVTLTISPNFDGGREMTSTYSIGTEIDLSKKRYFFNREGYNRDTVLYFDAASQNAILENKFIIEDDTTVYLGWTEWSDEELVRVEEYFDLIKEAKEITMRPKAWSGDKKAFSDYATFGGMIYLITPNLRISI